MQWNGSADRGPQETEGSLSNLFMEVAWVAGPVGAAVVMGASNAGMGALPALVSGVLASVGLTAVAKIKGNSGAALQRARAKELARLRELLEETDVVTWEYEPETAAFVYVSPQIRRFGYGLAEWHRDGFFAEVLHPDDREETLRSCRISTEQGLDHELIYRMRCADGRLVWIRDLVKVLQRPGKGPLLRGVFIDITAQKAAEEEVKRMSRAALAETERFELAFAGGSIGIWDWNPQSGDLVVNDS